MTETVGIISEYGILIVIAATFIYQVIVDKATQNKREMLTRERDMKYNESLSLLSESNQNIAKSLALLEQSINNNDKILRIHDERSILMKEDLTEIRTIVSQRIRK